mmetsp:Transcript_66210/g.197800  ORF Transcript_66210/g.197800 Transcript_66210/m.197800 type:complete len:109 (+) Transcript_66210:158-484(+)
MQQLPRFVAAAAGVLSKEQLDAARRMVSASADAAWASRVLPPFPSTDVCNEFVDTPLPAGGAPKFTWNWQPTPSGAFSCMDSRTQITALSVFIADFRLQLLAGEPTAA